jgi:thymidylate kinase
VESVLAAAKADDWKTVARAQRELMRRLRREDGINGLLTSAATFLRRRASPAPDPGWSVGLIGLDGAGKSTVAARLRSEVAWPTVSFYMGVWRTSKLDRAVSHILGAQLALRLGRLSRIALLVRYHRALGRLVVLDRYIIDANLTSPDLDWMSRLSAVLVRRTAAPPDRTVFLDVPPEVAYARKGELTMEELHQRREYYVALQDGDTHMVTIDGDQPLDHVLAEVSKVLWTDLARSRCHLGKVD